MNRFAASFVLALLLASGGCNESAIPQPGVDAGTLPGGLTKEQAARVIAKAGDRVITLGDFAASLERMDPFDRLRYQSKERRRELLSELINVELLAAEAKRRGLDKEPATQDAMLSVLRTALLNEARETVPTPAQITPEEVRAYYDANHDKFNEPERRRVSAIVMTDKRAAAKVLKEALKVKTAAEWGALVVKHSLTAPNPAAHEPIELAGDLGLVGPPEDAKGFNRNIPDPVRAVVFDLNGQGAIAEDLVEAEGRQYIVRLAGVTAPHYRTLSESDRAIRLVISQEKFAAKEREIEEDLRKRFKVQIDDHALESVKMPAGLDAPTPDDKAAPPKVEDDLGAPPPASSAGSDPLAPHGGI